MSFARLCGASALLSVCAALAACDPPIALAGETTLTVDVALPALTSPPGAPPLSATIEFPGVFDGPLLITDDNRATGSFTFFVEKTESRQGLLRVRGQLSAADDVATLVVADLNPTLGPGTETAITSVSGFLSAKSDERPWLDLNRNDVDNKDDFAKGCDPGVPPAFLRVSETDLQLPRDGDRAVVVVDNLLPRAIAVDLSVVDAPGVGIDIVSADGDASSLAALETLPPLEAGQSLIVAVSYASVDEFFAQGVIVVSGADVLDADGAQPCGTTLRLPVRVFANVAGGARPADPTQNIPVAEAAGGLDADAFTVVDGDHLASGLPINVPLAALPNGRRLDLGGGAGSIAADRVFVVDTDADTRLDVAVSAAPFDVDLAIVDAADLAVVGDADHAPAGSIESARLRNPSQLSGKVFVVVGVPGTTEEATLPLDQRQATVSLTVRASKAPRLTTRPEPRHGPVVGGTVVAFAGEGLDDDGAFFFGARAAACAVVDGPDVDTVSCTAPRGNLNAGQNPVDVVYVSPTTGERATLVDGFRYDPSTPRIDSVEPSVVVVDAAAALTLRGFGFVPGLELTIGGVPVPATVVDDATVFADAPDLDAGAYDVVVTVRGRDDASFTTTKEDALLYLAAAVPPPSLSAVFPSSGDVAGGTTINVSGSGFSAGARVFVGDDEASVLFVGAGTIIATTPAGAPGVVDVAVENPDQQRATLDDAFTFTQPVVPPPVIFALVPSTGSTAGGEDVTVLGAHFDDDAAVSFDGAAALVVSRSDGALVVEAPARGAAGLVDVVVTNGSGDSARIDDGYSYVAPVVLPPQVFSVSPASSPTAGGVTVTVLGARFDDPVVEVGGATVVLGSQSDSALVFTAPPSPLGGSGEGTGDVVVTNADGQRARVQNAFSWRDNVVVVRAPTIADVSPEPLHGKVGGEVLRLIGSDLDQTVGATVVAGAAPNVVRIPARVESDSASLVVVAVDAALPAGEVRVELVDAELGVHLSPTVAVHDPVPVSLDVGGRAAEGEAFTLLIGGADLNPSKLSGVRATPLDVGSGAEVVIAASFAAESVVAADVAAGVLGRGGWVIALVYDEEDGDVVVVPVDVLEVGGFCPGSALCETCGDNVRDPGEDCDGSDFDGESCVSNGFSGGTLSCSGCQFDFNACAQCGNGLVEIGEQCDGANLNGQSCTSRGFTAGTLACDADTCLFDTTACRTCGDGTCSVGETSANCAADCPATCGNATCNVGETCHTCPRDCGVCAPYRLTVTGGANQTARITEAFPAVVRVHLVDDNGDPVPNIDVTFNPEPGDVVSAATRVTDNAGDAFVTWTVGPRVGNHNLVVAATARDGALVQDQPTTVTNPVVDVAAGTVVHVAGNIDGASFAGSLTGRPAIRTGFRSTVLALEIEPSGDLLVLESARLTRIQLPEGVMQHVAGDPNGLSQASSDQNDGDGGPAATAKFVSAIDLAVDTDGTIYVADGNAFNGGPAVIRKIAVDGGISTVAGGGTSGQSPNDGDGGPALNAFLGGVLGIDVDDDGNVVVAESNTSVRRVRRVLLDRANPTTETLLFDPRQLGTNSSNIVNGMQGDIVAVGDLVVGSINSNLGGFSDVPGVLGPDGIVVAAHVAGNVGPAGLCRGSDGAFYGGNNNGGARRLQRFDLVGSSSVVLGSGTASTSGGDLGPGTSATIAQVGACTGDESGNIYVVDEVGSTSRVRMLRATALSTPLTVALRVKSGDNQTGLAGGSLPQGIIYELTSNVGGPVAPVAGAPVVFSTSQAGTFPGALTLSSVVGVANNPRLGRVIGAPGATAPVAVTARLFGTLGQLYPTSATANATLRLPVSGESTTWMSGATNVFFAGATINTLGLDADGGNLFGSPGVAADGRLLLASDGTGGVGTEGVFVVDGAGAVVRVAGGGNSTTDFGDGGAAVGASLPLPLTVAEDSAGNLYVGDSSLKNVRIITPGGLIDRFAGGGAVTTTPVDARSLQLNHPLRFAFEEDDDLVIGDSAGVFIVDGATRVARLVAPQGSCNSSTVAIVNNGIRGLAVASRPGAGAIVVGRVNATGACPVASGIHVFDIQNNQLVLPPRATVFAGATTDNVIGAAIDGDDTVYWITEINQTRIVHRQTAAGAQTTLSGLTSPIGIAVDPVSDLVFVYDLVNGATVLRVIAP